MSWRARPLGRGCPGCWARSCWSCRWPTFSIPFVAWSKASERSNRCSRTSSSSRRISPASSPACVWAFTRTSTAGRRCSSTFPMASGPCRPAAACPGRAAHRPNRRRPCRNGIAPGTSVAWPERTRSAAGPSVSTTRRPTGHSRGSVSSSNASMRRSTGKTMSRWRRRGPTTTSSSDARNRTWSRSSIAGSECTGRPRTASRFQAPSRAWSTRCGSDSALNFRAGAPLGEIWRPETPLEVIGLVPIPPPSLRELSGWRACPAAPGAGTPTPLVVTAIEFGRVPIDAAVAKVIFPDLPVTRDSIFVRLKLEQAPARERLGTPLLITLTSPARPRLWRWLRGA